MVDEKNKLHVTRGTFAIDIKYKGKDYYALVIPDVPKDDGNCYQILVPWLFNFKLGYARQSWVVMGDEPVDAELLEAVSKEITFVCTS